MAEVATIARPYAEAVFRLAESSGALAEWSRALAAIAPVAAHPDVQASIADPNLGAEPLYGLLMALTKADLPKEAQHFVRLLIANDRLTLLPEIHRLYEELKHEREGIVEAKIASAFPLDDTQLKNLVAGLERRFKRQVQPQVAVDPQLIGGVRIAVGDEVIDGSVRGKLADMAAVLKG
jgi:F-type H+-transporting ATPase subunit delta